MFSLDRVGTKRAKLSSESDSEEKWLESVVFKDSQATLTAVRSKQESIDNQRKEKEQHRLEDDEEEKEEEEEINFILDNTGDASLLDRRPDHHQDKIENDCVWQDDDDDVGFTQVFKNEYRMPKKFGSEHKYKEYLEHKFNSLNPEPKWAKVTKKLADKDPNEEDDDALERVAGDFVSDKFRISPNSLNYKSCGPIDRADGGKGAIHTIDFHPLDSYVLLAKREHVRLFHLDEKRFKQVKKIKFDDFAVEQAGFRPGGQQMLMTSVRNPGKIYYYDFLSDKLIKLALRRGSQSIHFRQFAFSPDDQLIAGTGHNNMVHVLNADNKEILFDLKINSASVATCFSPDSSKILIHSGEGKVYVFDVRNNGKCLHRFVDEGCIQGTAINISPNGQYLACGSDSGIVNVYDYQSAMNVHNREPEPVKRVTSLLSNVRHIKFNHSTEVMSISSNETDNAVKCVHLPTFNIFADFPRYSTNYGKVSDFAFSPHSYYCAIANEAGKNHLFRLLHYNEY